jgi:hypothetical protein
MRDMTSDKPPISTGLQYRRFTRTKAIRYRATGMKGATGWPVCWVGWVALQHHALPRASRMWDGGYQGACILMRRIVQYRIGLSFFHDAAEIHDSDAMAHLPNGAQIVAHEKHGRAELFLQIQQQIHHLRLDGNIKRTDRFIADQHGRIGRQSTRKHCALSLTAREFMRVTRALIWPKAHSAQQRLHAGGAIRSSADGVNVEWFCDLCCNRQSAIQGTQRVLKHHLHARALLPPSRAARLRHGGTFKTDTPRVRRFNAEHQATRGGFSASGFTHQTQGASPFQFQRNAIHGTNLDRMAKKPTPHRIAANQAFRFQ